jgi:Na+/melibiose symporter-like transporter
LNERVRVAAAAPDDGGMTTTAAAPAPRTTYRSVFAVGQFRVLCASMFLYVLGFEFEILGLSVVVYAQTRSAFLAALAFAMGFGPQAIGGALFTSLADRLPPRAVITGGMLLRAVPGVLIGLAPGLPVAAMLVLVALAAMIAPVFSAAVSRMLPDVLDGDRYVLGRSVLSLTAAGTQIVGLGLGGAVLAVLSGRWLLLSAGCALVLAAFVRLGLRPSAADAGVPADAAPPGPPAGPSSAPPAGPSSGPSAGPARAATRGAVRATLAGNAELLANRRVRMLLLAQWLPGMFAAGAESLIVPYTESLGHPAAAASPLLAAVPAGMLAGDVVIGRFCRPAMRRRLVFPLALLTGAPLLVLILHPAWLVVATALFSCGLGFGYQLGIQQAFLDSLPEGLRGQGFGLLSTGLMGGQGVTPPLAGAVAAVAGPAAAMAAAGAATVLATCCLRHSLAARQLAPSPAGPSRIPAS